MPPKLRAAAVINFLQNLAESKPRDFPSEMLGEARLLVMKYEDAETGLRLLLLVRLYAAFLPADGPLAFNEAVAALNRASRSRPPGTPEAVLEWPEYPWKVVALPVPLVEADEPGVTSAVASVDDDLMRARMRLGLLKSLLEKRQSELPPTPGRKPAVGAGRRPTP